MNSALGRSLASAWIGLGLVIFSAAIAVAGHIYMNADGHAGLTLVPVFMLFNSYVLLTFCNFTGGLALYFSSKRTGLPFSLPVKTIVRLGWGAQLLPFIYWIFIP